MALDVVVPVHDVLAARYRVLPQTQRLPWRVLPIVVKVDDVGAARMTPATQYGIVLTEVSRVRDNCDRNADGFDKPPAHLQGVVGAATIVDENNLVTAGDVECFDVADDALYGARGVVHRDDE